MTALTVKMENIDLEFSRMERSNDETRISHYIRKINSYELLSAEEELALANRWINDKDRDAANKLLTAHLKLVVKIASGYKGYNLPIEDLIAEGSLGLMKALKNFKPELGNRFSTYAMWWIKAEIKEYVLHNWSLVKMGTTRAQKRLFFSLRKLKRKIQEERGRFSHITDEDLESIANQLMLPPKAVKNMNARMGNRDFSLNQTFGGQDEDEDEWLNFLEESGPNQEETYIAYDEKEKREILLEKALATLSERESHIIRQRRLSDKPATLESLGEVYGVSRERIRQIEVSAFNKIQTIVLSIAQQRGM